MYSAFEENEYLHTINDSNIVGVLFPLTAFTYKIN